MAMQCDEKPRLLQKIQIQALAAELEKAEAEDLVELFKEVGDLATIFDDRQRLWTDVMEQQRERLASIVAAALCLYDF